MSQKDYYEILGVRPSAGPDEIELAYKGRRSQYHPDRYAQSDKETQAWATGKMQELNEAYTVLKDKGDRRRFDEQRPASTSRPGPPPSGAVREPEPSVSLAQALQGYVSSSEPFEKIFIAPNIPKKKLSGAIESYGDGVRPKDVVALIDDTVFGGAKEGVLVTADEIRFKAIFEPVRTWRLERIEEITSEDNRIYINGYELGRLNIPDKHDVDAFFELINAHLRQCASGSSDNEGDTPQDSRSDDADIAAGERCFVGLKQGFYSELERSLRHDIAAAGSKGEALTIELVGRLLSVSDALEKHAQRSRVPLSAAERSLLSSDMMRFELLTFAMAIIEHLLTKETSFDEDQIAEIVTPIATRTLLTYIVEVEGLAGHRTLRSVTNPIEALQKSHFFQEFKRRWRRYGLLLEGTKGNVAEEFRQSLMKPATFTAQEVARRVQLNLFSEDVIGRVLDSQSVPAFLGDMNEDIESALVEMFEQV